MKNWQIFLIFILASYMVFMSMKDLEPEYFSIHGIRYHIRIVNGFTNNSSLPLVIWCSSQDGDIGGRALQEGDDFSWDTGVSFWTSAPAFSCTMKWDGTRKKFQAFQVDRDRSRCGLSRKCFWLVKEDGFYISYDEYNWVKDFSWS